MNRARPAIMRPRELPFALAAMALVLLWTPATLAQGDWETCEGCHDETLVKQFAGSVHGRRLVELPGQGLESRQEDHHLETRALPDG